MNERAKKAGNRSLNLCLKRQGAVLLEMKISNFRNPI